MQGGGVVSEVAANDYIVSPFPFGGEVYSIKESLFENTYQLYNRENHIPSHAEILHKWSKVLRNEVGSIHRKSDVVFAKAVLDECDPVIETATDSTQDNVTIELWT